MTEISTEEPSISTKFNCDECKINLEDDSQLQNHLMNTHVLRKRKMDELSSTT